MDDIENQPKKAHRKRQAGSKAEKKKKKSPVEENLTAKQRNPKAFAFQSVNKVARQVRRTLDVQEKKHHIPVVDRTVAEPPPVLVAVVGPPKVGKSTLVRCLVKNFARQKVTNIKGPITVVSAKKKRITFIECNNDVNCMIDVAKTADLVLLMIDASFDYEMETLEFINICQVHGFPKIIGVLTHLDLFRDKKKLRKKKKTLKDRFWKEVYQGAKLFYLSGMINGEYQKTEVHNLGRFISVMKFRPLQWRSTHPYILADRMEDVTHPETLRKTPKADRSVCLYGYIRGCHYRSQTHVHIPGCGDFLVHNMSLLEDPCPLPDQIKKRSLNEKERLIWAPMSGVGGFVYDRDGIHMDASHLKDRQSNASHPLTQMVDAMLGSKKTIDEKMADAQFKMFTDSAVDANGHMNAKNRLGDDDDDDDDEDEDEDEGDEDSDEDSNGNHDSDDESQPAEKRRRIAQDSSATPSDQEEESDEDADGSVESDDSDENASESGESDNDDDDDDDDNDSEGDEEMDVDSSVAEKSDDENGEIQWKADLARKASEAFFRRLEARPNLAKLVYDSHDDASRTKDKEDKDKDKTIGGMFRAVETSADDTDGINGLDCCLSSSGTQLLEWDLDSILSSIKDCFVTGKWDDNDDASKRLADDDDLAGGFVDLETGEVEGEPDSSNDEGDDSEGSNEESDNGDDSGAEVTRETTAERRQRRMKEKLEKAKLRKKALFDMEYDDKGDGEKKTHFEEWKAEMELQAKLNRSEFDGLSDEARIQYEGFRPGLYVRVQINDVPAEFVDNFDATYPVVLGGLLPAEQSVGYVTVRLKQHRWYSRKLKTNDPLIISLGWRRFQTVVVYSMQDHNGRHRYIKYTPDHLHCHATFWGPITPQGTGMLGIQTVSSKTPMFRVAVTGAVVELDKAFTVVKKLKLEGTPYKIYKNTAFIQGMFNSALEVAKFEGSLLQTVSKIRGQVKKAVREGAAGSFRATFEDKILLSGESDMYLSGRLARTCDNHYLAQVNHVPTCVDYIKSTYRSKAQRPRRKVLKKYFLHSGLEIGTQIPQFYNPVTSLLLPIGAKDTWQGMKTVGELKREKGIKNAVDIDHLYRPVERKPRVFAPLTIPRELQKSLPFVDKPKIPKPVKDLVQSQRVAVVREPKERKVAQMMKRLKVMYEHKRKQERATMRQRAEQHQKQMSRIEAGRAVKRKERAKHAYFLLGQAEKRGKERE